MPTQTTPRRPFRIVVRFSGLPITTAYFTTPAGAAACLRDVARRLGVSPFALDWTAGRV